MNHAKTILHEELGATTIEYAFLLAAIAGVLLIGALSLGQGSRSLWGEISSSVNTAPSHTIVIKDRYH